MRYIKDINDLTFNMYPVICDKGEDVIRGAAIIYNVMDYERLTTKINKSKNSSKFLSRYNYGFYTKRKFYQREGRGFIRLNIDQTSIYKFIKKNCPTIKFTYKEMDNYNLKNVFIDVAQFNSDFFNNTLLLLNESTTLEPLSESAFSILNEEIVKVKESITQEEYDLDLITEAANLANSLDAAKIYFTLLMSYLSEVNVYPNKYLVFDLKSTSLTYGNMMSINRGMLKNSYTPDDMLMQLIRFEFTNIEVLNLFKGYTIILEGSNGMCKFNIDSYIQRLSEDKDKSFKNLLKKLTIIMNRIDFKEDAPEITEKELKEIEDNPPFTELDVVDVNTNTIVDNLVSHNDSGETISNIENIVKETLDEESAKDEKKSSDEIVGEMLSKVIDIRIKNTKQIMPKERDYLKKLTNVSVNNEGIRETIDLSKKSVVQPKVYDIKTINNDMKEVKFDNMAKTYDTHFRDHDVLNYCKLLSETSTPLYLDKVNKKDSSDRLNSKDIYQLFFKDENGNKHTFSVDVPKLVPDTDYIIANGDKKKLVNQIVPYPITKVGDEVYIVTNYNKVFMFKKGGRYINPHQSIVSRILLDLVKSNKTFTGVNLLSTYLTNMHDGRMSSEIIEISKYLTSIERDGISIFLNPNRCKFTDNSIIIGTYKGYEVHVDKTTDLVTLKDDKGDIHNDILTDSEYELELVEEQRTLMIDKHKDFIDLSQITYKNFDNHIHSVLPYEDKLTGKKMTLRYRAECLIFSDDGKRIYLCKSKENDERNRRYYLPGGSAEPTKHIEEQLRAEIREEAGLEVVNLNYANSFITDFEGVYPEWHKKYLQPNGLTYTGYFTELFVAKYAGPIMEEVPNTKDIDNYMRLNGKFYDIALIYSELTHEHKEAIDKFLNIYKVGTSIEEESIDSLKEIMPTLESRHGMSTSKLYYIWTNMKYRCYNKTSPKYHVYGGRGIKMDKEWLVDFNNFYLWAIDNGYVDGLSLDRVDNNKGYTPSNCRWITVPENSAKRAIDNKDYVIQGISPEGDTHKFKNISQFARDNKLHGPNVNAVVLGQRNHHKGWTFSKIREGYVFNSDNVEYKVDEWEKKKGQNVLFITGLSGGGKSTLSYKIGKEHESVVNIFPVDIVERYHLVYHIDKERPFLTEIFDKVFKKNPEYKTQLDAYIDSKKVKSKRGVVNNTWVGVLNKIMRSVLDIIYEDPNQLYIVEGIQIAMYFDEDMIEGKPTIIIGTGIPKSILQRFKRGSENGKIDWSKHLRNEFIQLVHWYVADQEPDMKRLRKKLTQLSEANEYRNFNNTKLINNDSELIHYIEDFIKEDEIGAKIAGLDKILHPSFFNNGFARIIKFEDKNAGVITLQSSKKKLDEKVYYVGVYVKPDYRGLGLARKALNMFSQEMNVDVLVANIASDNESSKSSHLKNGFRRANANEEIKYGVKNNIREMYIRYEKEFLSEAKVGTHIDKYKDENIEDERPDSDYDEWQLQKGIEIEHEHSPNDDVAKIIAKDHLDEFPDYYTRLDKMENEADAELKPQSEEVVRKNGRYFVLSDNGKNLGKKNGYATKKDAMERLKQVEVFKHMKESNEFPDNREFKVSEFLLRVIREIFKEDETVKDIFDKNRNVPSMFSSTYIKIIGKELPLIMCLCYTHGLFTVLDSLDEKDYKIVPKEEKKIRFDKLNIGVVEFKNSYLTYDNRKQELVSLFAYMSNYDFTNYNIEELEDKETNGLLLSEIAGSTNTPLYLDNYKDLLIDPVTKEILRDLNQPTEFLGVFLYANNLLNTGFSAIQEDLRYCRIRNNEILTASFYEAIASAYGDYSVKKKRGSTLASFSLNKNAVINVLHNVSSYQEFSVTNPVASIDATREVSFKGLHGKNLDRAFGLDSRLQNDTYAGIIGASSVYSAGVGVSKHLTLNPKIKHIRGYVDITKDPETLGASEVELATELNAPLALTHNSPERNFMDVSQQKQTIPVIDMQPLFISSGFNKYIPKAGTEFTYLAKDDGVVEEITSVYLKVKYKEKGTKIFPLTLIERNTNKSKYYKNELKSAFKVGDKFHEGDVLAYNRDFFSNKAGEIIYNTGTLATIAVHMTANNFEDSFELTSELAHRMATETTKLRSIKIPANTKIKNYIKEFDKLIDAGVPLLEYEFMVEDEGLTKFLDVNDIDELTTITKKNLFRGKVISCKIYYTCDESEFSPSMKSFVKFITDWVKDNRDERFELPLKVPEGTKLNGKRLEKNEVLIEYYVTYIDVMSDGDKLTVFSALKGIVSKVIPEVNAPYGVDTGIKVEGILSTMSPKARKTEAFLTTGLINRAMEEFTKNMRNQLE